MVFLLKKQRSVLLDGYINRNCAPGWEAAVGRRESGVMAVDWLKIKTEYVSGNVSYRKLAEKHSIPFPTLRDRATSEGWKKQRDKQRNEVVTKSEQKTVEKITDAVSDEAASKARIKAIMIRLAEGWFKAQEESVEKGEAKAVDPSDFRKMVQSCVELGVLEAQEGESDDSVRVIIDV